MMKNHSGKLVYYLNSYTELKIYLCLGLPINLSFRFKHFQLDSFKISRMQLI